MNNNRMKGQESLSKTVFKALVTLSIPTIAEEILAQLFQYADTAMVGRLGPRATTAVSTSGTINWLIINCITGIATAFLILISQAYGAKDEKRIRKLSQQALLLTIAVGMFLSISCVMLAPYIPVFMGTEESLRPQATMYFAICSLPMVFRAASLILGATIRAVHNTKTPMIINMCANFVNVILNALLIYGFHMGVFGAAIATATSYVVAGTFMFIAYRRNFHLHYEWKKFSVDTGLLRECFKVGLPLVGANTAACSAYVVFASLVSSMGTIIFAAHAIAISAESIFYVPGYGLRTATSALIGSARGEANEKKLRMVMQQSVAMTVLMMCVTGLILFFTARPVMSIFSTDADVITLGSEMLRLVALTEPFFGLMIVMEGICNGNGKTKYVMFVEMVGMWGIRVLFTFLCVKVWHLGLREVWYCMIACNIVKALLLLARYPALLRIDDLSAKKYDHDSI